MEIEGGTHEFQEERYLFDLIQNNIKNKVVSKLLERKPTIMENMQKLILFVYGQRADADKEDNRKDNNEVGILPNIKKIKN